MASKFWLPVLGVACAACGSSKTVSEPGDGHQIGTGDGSPASVDVVTVFQPDTSRQATDLAFDPGRGDLWVLLRQFVDGPACTTVERNGCEELEGSVAIVR